MAMASDLVAAVTRVTGVQSATVAQHARALREAGLIAKAGRGRRAAQMSARDAAALLIALMAGGPASRAPQNVAIARAMDVYERDVDTVTELDPDVVRNIPPVFFEGHTLFDLVEALISTASANPNCLVDIVTGQIYFYADYTAIVYVDIFTSRHPARTSFSVSYAAKGFSKPTTNDFCYSSSTSFRVLAEIGKILAPTVPPARIVLGAPS